MLNAGLDATQSYQKVEHHLNPDIHAALKLFTIGRLRRLNFGSRWGIIFGKEGAKTIFVRDIFRMWVKYLYLIIEQQNILQNQMGLRERPTAEW